MGLIVQYRNHSLEAVFEYACVPACVVQMSTVHSMRQNLHVCKFTLCINKRCHKLL